MTHYSMEPRDQIFVKGDGFFSFTKSVGKNIGNNISKKSNEKYSQKLLDHTATEALKTASKRAIQKAAGKTGDLIGNKIAVRVTKVSRTSPQNSSETVQNEHDKEIPKERYISPEGNTLGYTLNQSSKFRTKNCAETNDDSHVTYNSRK